MLGAETVAVLNTKEAVHQEVLTPVLAPSQLASNNPSIVQGVMVRTTSSAKSQDEMTRFDTLDTLVS